MEYPVAYCVGFNLQEDQPGMTQAPLFADKTAHRHNIHIRLDFFARLLYNHSSVSTNFDSEAHFPRILG